MALDSPSFVVSNPNITLLDIEHTQNYNYIGHRTATNMLRALSKFYEKLGLIEVRVRVIRRCRHNGQEYIRIRDSVFPDNDWVSSQYLGP